MALQIKRIYDPFQESDGVRLLVDRLWRDLTFTRALTGPTFPVSAAVAITRSLTGTAPDRGNLNRRLASVRGLGISHQRIVMGRGRPGTLWEWQSTHMEPESADIA